MKATVRLRQRHLAEQDYWLSYLDEHDRAALPSLTDEHRYAFFVFDSRGGALLPQDNPILFGKVRHGQTGVVLRDSYGLPGWIGGVYLYHAYAMKGQLGLRSLAEWFGAEAVVRWAEAARLM